MFLLLKKNDFDLSKYYICFVGCKKKGFVITKIQICFVIYKKKNKKAIFDEKNSDLFYYIFLKKIFEEENFTHNLNLCNHELK